MNREGFNSWSIKKCSFICIVIASYLAPFSLAGQHKFEHRGYLGWMVDFSSKPVLDHWPSIRLDSAIFADYIETLDFLKKSGMNEITPWVLFTDENWEPEIEKTITPERKKLIDQVIQAAHDRQIKVLCGLGVYSWGFGKIIQLHPEIACPVNHDVMDLANPAAWEWQRKVYDYILSDFEFDGFSLQCSDKGWCQSGENKSQSAMGYYAQLYQKSVQYIRSGKPGSIIGLCGWGMNMSAPEDLDAIYEMTRNVNYLTDVGETAGFQGKRYREKLMKAIAPCAYGNTAIPNIEPILAMKRDIYFIPTVLTTGQQIKEIFKEGGLSCEAYARTRGNPGDRLTIDVAARLLSNPKSSVQAILKKVLQEEYHPVNHETTKKLEEIVSISVIGQNIYEADRFATAAFAMQKEGINFIERLDGLEAYMIDNKGIATMTSGFEKYTKIKN